MPAIISHFLLTHGGLRAHVEIQPQRPKYPLPGLRLYLGVHCEAETGDHEAGAAAVEHEGAAHAAVQEVVALAAGDHHVLAPVLKCSSEL